jgi:hypothetical protein
MPSTPLKMLVMPARHMSRGGISAQFSVWNTYMVAILDNVIAGALSISWRGHIFTIVWGAGLQYCSTSSHERDVYESGK